MSRASVRTAALEIMLFTVGGTRYGIDLGQISGVVRELPEEHAFESWADESTILFRGRQVPVFMATDMLAPCAARSPKEVIIFNDGAGLFGMAVDSTDDVVEVSPGNDLYTFPPQEISEESPCRPWGLFTYCERPVILLDMTTVAVH